MIALELMETLLEVLILAYFPFVIFISFSLRKAKKENNLKKEEKLTHILSFVSLVIGLIGVTAKSMEGNRIWILGLLCMAFAVTISAKLLLEKLKE